MYGTMPFVCCIFFLFVIVITAYHLGEYSVNLLLLKSSIIKGSMTSLPAQRFYPDMAADVDSELLSGVFCCKSIGHQLCRNPPLV